MKTSVTQTSWRVFFSFLFKLVFQLFKVLSSHAEVNFTHFCAHGRFVKFQLNLPLHQYLDSTFWVKYEVNVFLEFKFLLTPNDASCRANKNSIKNSEYKKSNLSLNVGKINSIILKKCIIGAKGVLSYGAYANWNNRGCCTDGVREQETRICNSTDLLRYLLTVFLC